MIKCATVGYVPPPHYRGANSFVENIHQFKTKYPVFLYSDHVGYGFHRMANPEMIDERAKRQNPKWAINNAIFIAGMRLAAARFTHIIYIESDCRVMGDNWDEAIFDEYFNLPFPPIAAGSLVCHSCVNGGAEFYQRFSDMIGRNRSKDGKRQHLIPIYGIPNPPKVGEFPPQNPNIIAPGDMGDERFKPAVYPNGALGVYDMAWMREIFGLNEDGTFKPNRSFMEVVLSVAWDHLIGLRIYDRFGSDVFEVVAHMDSVFSSYGDKLSTEEQRLDLLHTGRARAVHQVKSEAKP